SRFRTNADRVVNREPLTAAICAATGEWRRGDLLQRLEESGIPAGPINSVAEAFADPQVVHRAMALAMRRHPSGPVIAGVRLPIRFSEVEPPPPRPSPLLNSGL